ncbi:Uncharacterised protein [uncultured archaeon]|nr:Uncharacterised protein [uncultured archaeon]
MKSKKSETLSKQAKAALRESEERFRLVAAAFELKRDSPILQSQPKTTSYGSQRVGW